jgi:zinc transporter 9
MGFVKFLRTTSDPTILAVLFEDSIACVGVVIALGGIGLSFAFVSTIPDAISSILIGLLLGLVAVWLGYKNRALILGVAIPKEIEDKMVAYLSTQPAIEKVLAVQSRIVGSDQYSLKAEVDFNGRVLAERLVSWLENEAVVKTGSADQTADQRLQFAREFGEKLMQEQGKEVNRIEDELRKQFPQLKYIDLESD